MKTELLIELYSIDNDRFLREINISDYDLKKINKICPPEIPDDFDYCNSTFIEEASFIKLKKYIKELSILEYKDYIYNIITRSL